MDSISAGKKIGHARYVRFKNFKSIYGLTALVLNIDFSITISDIYASYYLCFSSIVAFVLC